MIRYLRTRQRLVLSVVVMGGFLLGCFAFGVAATRDPYVGVVPVGAMFALVVYWAKPELMVWIALFYTFGALPIGLYVGKVLGPVTIFVWHVVLLTAIAYLIQLVRPRFSDYLPPAILLLTILYFTAIGFANGHSAEAILHEVACLCEMLAGYLLALLIVYGDYIKGATQTLILTLWFSAVMVILSSSLGLRLTGRFETIGESTTGGSVTRLIVPTTAPAIAVLAALMAAKVLGRVRPATFFALGVPALIISLVAFSRGTLIVIGLAGVVAFFAKPSWQTLRRAAVFAVTSAALLAAMLPVAMFLLQHSKAGAWLGHQLAGFNYRVLGGVKASALAVDDSTQYRLVENADLGREIAKAPVFGHGLGYAYRLPFGDEGSGSDAFGFDSFTVLLGTTYAHNFYLWWLVKAGALGMVVFAWFALRPVVRALRSVSTPAKIAGAVSVGLLVLNIVGPNIEDTPDSVVYGMVLGSAMGFANLARRRPDDPDSAGPDDGATDDITEPIPLLVGGPAAAAPRRAKHSTQPF
ncbi:O-antigen polymerase family protein [Mycobacterium triplex]|uniref:O-antigen polymerase family protein n=1 Tax=Mycobacterium triplex TaxID=47839 RepID=A0A024K407_9MYCO|nr:O-antigen polymerase family protein [Mycobacterium triplex]